MSETLLITRGKTTIEVPPDFFGKRYVFGRERFMRIWEQTGLTHKEFAAKYGFKYSVVVSWTTLRTSRGGPHNPNPEARLTLAFIEHELALEEKKWHG